MSGERAGGDALLRISDLHTHFHVGDKVARAVVGVDLTVGRGEFVGVVGESGSGKSVTALSVVRLVPDPPGRIVSGRVEFEGEDLLKASWDRIRELRGRRIGMIFQEPMTSLNPVFPIGTQLTEGLRHHLGMSQDAAEARAVELLAAVGIPDPRGQLANYPHRLSGGMRQRIMIAMALVCEPGLLIADEPTTALDVTIQAQILDLLQKLQRERGTAVMLITHSLAVVAETCQRVYVMYGGMVQEHATVLSLFDRPSHPYTRGLLDSIPDRAERGKPMRAIPGMVPTIFDMPSGCRFRTRCPLARERCAAEVPALREISPGHEVRCHFAEEVA